MKEIRGPISFLDWLTYGMIGDYFRGNELRGQEALDSPSLYTVANWLLGGVPDLVAGTFQAEEPLSFEHWMNSLGLATLLFGTYQTVQQAAAARAPNRLPNPDVPHAATEDGADGSLQDTGKNNDYGINLEHLGFSATAQRHYYDVYKSDKIVRLGENEYKTIHYEGESTRPYIQNGTTLVIDNTIASGKPSADPGGIPNGLRWDVPGALNGKDGI